MTKDKTGVEELDPTNTEGDDSDGAADQSKKMVPLAALEAERKSRQKLETDLARLSGTVEGLKASQQKPATVEPKVYTRTELRALVTEGKITEDQMDAQLEQQLEAKLSKKVETATATTVAQTRIANEVNQGIAAYLEAHPDLSDSDSDVRTRVQAAFNKLVLRGAPEGAATELTAMENALGTLTPKGRKRQLETHEETGGSGDDDRGGSPGDGWAKGLSPAQKKHYQKQIDKGIYKGHADKGLIKEIEIVRARGKAH